MQGRRPQSTRGRSGSTSNLCPRACAPARASKGSRVRWRGRGRGARCGAAQIKRRLTVLLEEQKAVVDGHPRADRRVRLVLLGALGLIPLQPRDDLTRAHRALRGSLHRGADDTDTVLGEDSTEPRLEARRTPPVRAQDYARPRALDDAAQVLQLILLEATEAIAADDAVCGRRAARESGRGRRRQRRRSASGTSREYAPAAAAARGRGEEGSGFSLGRAWVRRAVRPRRGARCRPCASTRGAPISRKMTRKPSPAIVRRPVQRRALVQSRTQHHPVSGRSASPSASGAHCWLSVEGNAKSPPSLMVGPRDRSR